MDIVSTNMTNTIPKNMTNTISPNVSTNSDDKEVKYQMDCYILYTVLLVIILQFIVAIICYHYIKHRSKPKKTFCHTKNKKSSY